MENEHWIVAARSGGCLWSLHWLKDRWWEQRGARFFRIHSCLHVLSTSLVESLLYCVFSPGFHLSFLYTGVPAFLLDPTILTQLVPYSAGHRHSTTPYFAAQVAEV